MLHIFTFRVNQWKVVMLNTEFSCLTWCKCVQSWSSVWALKSTQSNKPGQVIGLGSAKLIQGCIQSTSFSNAQVHPKILSWIDGHLIGFRWCSGSIQILESHGIESSNFPGLESHEIRPKCWKIMENEPNGCCILEPNTRFWPIHVHTILQDWLCILCISNYCQLKHVETG